MEKRNRNQYETIFYQGIVCAQTHMTKYIGKHAMLSTTDQTMYCRGRHALDPIDVLIKPFIGKEIKDVNSQAFTHALSYLNPVKLFTACAAKIINYHQGIAVLHQKNKYRDEDIDNYSINLSEVSIGQETDMESHYEKYTLWKAQSNGAHLILYGVSRGAATTFNAFAKYQYPEVKLVVLEGCFYTLNDVLHNRYFSPISKLVSAGLALFTRYHDDGPSPAKSLKNFPKNVPVVFITSKADKFIPSINTEKLAEALKNRQKNDVYVLTLEKSSHANYALDDPDDRDKYQRFIHAVYQRYHIPCNEKLAEEGRALLQQSTIYLQEKSKSYDYEASFTP